MHLSSPLCLRSEVVGLMASPREPGEGQLTRGEILTADLGFLLLLPFLELTLHLVQLHLVGVLQDVSDGLWEWVGVSSPPPSPHHPRFHWCCQSRDRQRTQYFLRGVHRPNPTGAHTSCVPGATPFRGKRYCVQLVWGSEVDSEPSS